MSRVHAVAAFLYDFIVGDDPLIAVFVVLALVATAALAALGWAAWWLLPIAVLAALAWAVLRASDPSR